MERKTTWMRCLLIGISLLIILAFVQCKKRVDYFVRGDFVYVNSTDSVIEVKGDETFVLKPDEQHVIKESGEGPEIVTTESYVAPFSSAMVIYNSNKCDTLASGPGLGKGEGPLGINNYVSEKVGERHFKFTYTFTNADFADAKPCK